MYIIITEINFEPMKLKNILEIPEANLIRLVINSLFKDKFEIFTSLIRIFFYLRNQEYEIIPMIH